jgi:phage portal protein BeeE
VSVVDRFLEWLNPPEERAQYDPWASLYNSVLFNNVQYPLGQLTQTIGGTKEEIDASFAGIVQGAYRSNGIVFAVELARLSLFSQARFVYRRQRNGEPGDTFSTRDLDILEHPWPGGVTSDLLTSALLDHDLAGNAFIARRDSDRGRLRRLRPDWVTIVLGSFEDADVEAGDINADLLGYVYHPGGKYSGREPVVLQRTEVAHFRGMPDPLAAYRGMSWLTPVLREIESDSAATGHKLKFFENGATPNMIVSLDAAVPPEQFKTYVELFKEKEPVGLEVYKTLYLGGGADATVVGSNLRQMDFKTVQGAGESRIAAAGGVPPVIAGFSEGLQAATYSNYSQARRRFADLTTHPSWQNFCGSMQTIIPTPPDAELWYLDKHIPFLREDAKDRAEIFRIQMMSVETGVRAGFDPDTVKAAVMAESLSGLKHTGLYSVQLQPPLPDGPAPEPDVAPESEAAA